MAEGDYAVRFWSPRMISCCSEADNRVMPFSVTLRTTTCCDNGDLDCANNATASRSGNANMAFRMHPPVEIRITYHRFGGAVLPVTQCLQTLASSSMLELTGRTQSEGPYLQVRRCGSFILVILRSPSARRRICFECFSGSCIGPVGAWPK